MGLEAWGMGLGAWGLEKRRMENDNLKSPAAGSQLPAVSGVQNKLT